MKDKFSPNLLDNDPNFEHEPNKIIKADSAAWFAWLAANESFRFNAGDNSYRARKEFNQPAKTDYWYAVKKVNGRLHKKFIGKTEQITHARLIEISKLIMQPPQSRKPAIEETDTTVKENSNPDLMELIQSLSLRLDNLEKKQVAEAAEVIDTKGFEDAIARLKDELHNKDMQLSEVTKQLTNANSKLTELTNELSNKDMQLSEVTNQLSNANIQLLELTNQLDNSDSKPTELTNQLTNDLDNSDMQLSTEQIIEILGIDEIIQNKGNKDFKIYIEWVRKQGINDNIKTHRKAIEKSLPVKLTLKDDLADLKSILKALGYETKPNRNRAKGMVNEVATEIKSTIHFTLP